MGKQSSDGSVVAAKSKREPTIRDVPAVTKAVAILRILSAASASLSLNEIARALDLVPSTCLHILRVLVSEELVAHEAQTKRYTLNAGLLNLVRPLVSQGSVSHRIQPLLDGLTRDLNVTATLVRVNDVRHFIVVAVAVAEGIRVQIDLGMRAPALISATGRCLAAFGDMAPAVVRAEFQKLRWDNPPAYERWLGEVEEARAQGFGVDEGNYIAGMTSIAAPLPAANGLQYCVTAVGLTEQLSRVGLPVIGQRLVEIARQSTSLRH